MPAIVVLFAGMTRSYIDNIGARSRALACRASFLDLPHIFYAGGSTLNDFVIDANTA